MVPHGVQGGAGGERLLQLRNPWGKLEWRGDWSDQSPLWTPEYQAEVGFDGVANDGIFWMLFEDMITVFDQVDICKVDDDGIYSFMPVQSSHAGYSLIKFTVP